MRSISPSLNTIDLIREFGGDACKLCYQCGTCTGSCPWNLVREFQVRGTMLQTKLGLTDFNSEDMWLCVTCNRCVEKCPRGVEIIDIWRSLRRAIVEIGIGTVPESLRFTSKNIAVMGNPQGESREKRIEWTQNTDVGMYSSGMEILYFTCCYNGYDPRSVRVAEASARVFKSAGVSFGILGEEQSCCGESIRKGGNEGLFNNLAANNTELIKQTGANHIVVSSPHCYQALKNEYPEMSSKIDISHSVQFVDQLIKNKRITFTKQISKKVTFHDSCYLGRHNNIFDEPREILKGIPGIDLVEMRNSHHNSLCCGGGGGRIWEETKLGERFADLRIQQALDVGAEIIVAACPYCISNLEDSVLTMDKSSDIAVEDIIELVAEAI